MGDTRQVKFKNILAYGSGDFFGGGSFLIISTLFMVFLTNVAKIPPQYAGLIVLIGKAWDAISDPLIGILSDRSKSKFGRRHVFFLYGIIPVAISYYLLWSAVHCDSTALKVLYYIFTYSLFSTVFTVVMVPYNALVTEMSTEYKTRTRLSGAKMAFSQFSALIAGTIPSYIVNNMYKDNPEAGFRLVGLIFGILYAIPWIIVFFGTFEQPGLNKDRKAIPIKDNFKQLKTLLENRTFRVHISMYLLAYVAMDILSASFIFYTTYYIGRPEKFYFYLGIFLLSQLCALGFYMHIANKIGKGKTYRIGASIVVCVMLAFFVVLTPQTPNYIIYLLCAVMGLGFSAIISMPWAMLPESCDVEILCHGRDRSGAVAGMFTLIRKLIQAVVLWLFGITLATFGFDGSAAVQSDIAIMAIRVSFTFIPLILMIFGVIMSYKYKVTPKTFQIAQNEIKRIKLGGNKIDIKEENKIVIEQLTGHPYID
jgi:oligogalacturonide transporter